MSAAGLASALSPEYYAVNSVLKSGRWARVSVTQTGMQLISTADLQALGFKNIENLKVYGTGGGMVPERLYQGMADDLPQVASVVTPQGIVFFGRDNITWNYVPETGLYTHTLNPYSNSSYYFISDCEGERLVPPAAETLSHQTDSVASGFKAHLLHEKDIFAPAQAGRMLLGEDFGTTKMRVFDFRLTGQSSPSVTAKIRFGARTVGGASTLGVYANGTKVPSSYLDQIATDCVGDFIACGTVTKKFDHSDPSLGLGIQYSNTGKFVNARLDYIELFYERGFALDKGELNFYGDFKGKSVRLSGGTDGMVIWDLTDPVSPKSVNYAKDGDGFIFTPPAGYHEYVAFNPKEIETRRTQNAGKISNQDIHGLPTPDMVIVAEEDYSEAAERIAALHREHDGMLVHVLSPNKIYNEFSGGIPDVMAFRKMLKMWHDRPGDHKIKYALLMGRGLYATKSYDPAKHIGYTPLPMWQAPNMTSVAEAYSTDDIIGMLDDNVPGETFYIEAAKIQVAVGRLPVRNVTEANDIAYKLERYMNTNRQGGWHNRVLMIADDQDEAIHLTQAESVHAVMHSSTPEVQIERLYLDTYPLEQTSVGMTYPNAKMKMMRSWKDGVVLTNYIGHGAPTSWTHEKLLEWKDVISATNPYPSFLYAATCSFGYWDADEQSGAEIMVLNPKGGFIGAIVPSRSVFMGPNGTLNLFTAQKMLTYGPDRSNIAVGDIYVYGKNKYPNANKLRYCLMSDPALKLPIPEGKIRIDEINGVDLKSSKDFPELQALGKAEVKGIVLGIDGTVDSNYNGEVMLELYDAEKPIETYGNGEKGKKVIYNDRKSRLAQVRTSVKNGEWSVSFRLPKEIENNYSPARIVAYASNPEGKEAHGYTHNLYVYGYSETAVTDSVGPEITSLTINNRKDGLQGPVNSNPVLYAVFMDESGINISDSGIGHKMSLVIDGKHIYDDLSAYYTPSPSSSLVGSVAYPIQGLLSGNHTAELCVYDNANNVSRKTIDFTVGETMDPTIMSLTTDCNPASTGVTIFVELDMPNTQMNWTAEVYDLSGRKIWSKYYNETTTLQGGLETRWNLQTSDGQRVGRGIYLVRVRVETAEGRYDVATTKLAVTAQ